MLITQEEMKIINYRKGEMPPEGPQNLLENKLALGFFVKGFEGYEIDPRAGRLEFAYQIRDSIGAR